MDVSRGRCLLTPLRKQLGWSQLELSRRTGYDPDIKLGQRVGYSQRMISHFEDFDGKGKGKPMSPEAMYLMGRLFGILMEGLYEWNVIGEVAE
jgi:transcriptional regulator with XRE-family HTH domain